MSLRYSDGSYVGGCQAQILGTITVFICVSLQASGVDLIGIIGKGILCLIGLGILYIPVLIYKSNKKSKKRKALIMEYFSNKLNISPLNITIWENRDKYGYTYYKSEYFPYSRSIVEISYIDEGKEKTIYKFIYGYNDAFFYDIPAIRGKDIDGYTKYSLPSYGAESSVRFELNNYLENINQEKK